MSNQSLVAFQVILLFTLQAFVFDELKVICLTYYAWFLKDHQYHKWLIPVVRLFMTVYWCSLYALFIEFLLLCFYFQDCYEAIFSLFFCCYCLFFVSGTFATQAFVCAFFTEEKFVQVNQFKVFWFGNGWNVT